MWGVVMVALIAPRRLRAMGGIFRFSSLSDFPWRHKYSTVCA